MVLEVVFVCDAFRAAIQPHARKASRHERGTVIAVVLFDVELLITALAYIFGALLTVLSMDIA